MALTPRALRTLHLLPRILALLFIVFVSMFALDVFEMEGSLLQKIGGFFIHLIPTYILIIVFLIARKWEIGGGVVYIFLGLFYIIWARGFHPLVYVIMSGPLVLTGLLFILNGYLNKMENQGKLDRS